MRARRRDSTVLYMHEGNRRKRKRDKRGVEGDGGEEGHVVVFVFCGVWKENKGKKMMKEEEEGQYMHEGNSTVLVKEGQEVRW